MAGRRRDTIEGQLQPVPSVVYGAEARASNYPTAEVMLSPELLAAVARTLAEQGWPPVRHERDFRRLAQALQWYSSGPPASAVRWWEK